jgi:hypothetical protein
MPTLVHLADAKETSSIIKNGLKIGKRRYGVFCMPVLRNFYIAHQWLRELKRRGVKTFVGVYFKMDSKIKVYAGKFNEEHRYITLGEAIKEIQSMEDPLGYEIIIDRKIEAKEINKIKNLPQTIGWRYKPGSNGLKPCSCDYCIGSSIKGNRIRQKYATIEKVILYKEILEKLKIEQDVYAIEDLLCLIRSKRRKADPRKLLFLLDKNIASIDQELACTLKMYKHKATKEILLHLLNKEDSLTKEFATESMLELYGKK